MSSSNFSNFGNLANPDEDAQFQELLRLSQNDPDVPSPSENSPLTKIFP